ncbi:MAG: hypothetical protein ACUVT9_07270 [Candidatus Bathycorpusculaceae bacterium]
MPAPSDLATRLADDLAEVGKLFGFEAVKEQPIHEGSKFRVDVFWKMQMPAGSPFPTVNIASIEIQYSDSPASISHGILKAEQTLHPAIHFVISYYELSDDYKNNVLRAAYPYSGLKIIDGEDKVRELNLWITRFLAIPTEEKRLAAEGKKIHDFAVAQLPNVEEPEIKERIRQNFQFEIEKVFLPPKIASLLEKFAEIASIGSEYDRTLIDNVFATFIEFVQSKLREYHIPRVSVSASPLFTEFNIEEEFADRNIEFRSDIEIEQDRVVIRDLDNYALEIEVEDGNACIQSRAGLVCREGLNAEDLICFLQNASEEIEKCIGRYRISKEDQERLNAIKKALS